MTTSIVCFMISAFFLVTGIVCTYTDSRIKVGDVFGHLNPGISDNPTEPDHPFAGIYKVVEITDGKARLHWTTTTHPAGYDTWMKLNEVGEFDKKLSKKRAK